MYYYQHHIGDFKSATAHLDDHQLATYLRMLWTCYDSELPLSGSIEDIAFAMRSDEKTVRLLLRHFFTETPEGWVNQRCKSEIEQYHAKSEKAKLSANARWNNANAMRTHSERNANEPVFDANQEPRTKNQEPILNLCAPAKPSRKKPSRTRPADWKPNDKHIEMAASLGLSLSQQIERFTDWHDSRGSVFADWDAAFRTWLGKAKGFQAKPTHPAMPPTTGLMTQTFDQSNTLGLRNAADWLEDA